VAEEKFHGLSDASAGGRQWLVVSEMERREQFEDFPFCRLRVPSCVLPLLVHHK
jgi:hypothetical protein